MAKQVKKQQVENKPVEKGKVTYPLGKINFILMAICLLLIIIGFWLMTGDANVGDKFNENLFESSRVTTGPIIASWDLCSWLLPFSTARKTTSPTTTTPTLMINS